MDKVEAVIRRKVTVRIKIYIGREKVVVNL